MSNRRELDRRCCRGGSMLHCRRNFHDRSDLDKIERRKVAQNSGVEDEGR